MTPCHPNTASAVCSVPIEDFIQPGGTRLCYDAVALFPPAVTRISQIDLVIIVQQQAQCGTHELRSAPASFAPFCEVHQLRPAVRSLDEICLEGWGVRLLQRSGARPDYTGGGAVTDFLKADPCTPSFVAVASTERSMAIASTFAIDIWCVIRVNSSLMGTVRFSSGLPTRTRFREVGGRPEESNIREEPRLDYDELSCPIVPIITAQGTG
jgi:hypothetical protein